MKILIMGLPGSRKSTFAEKLTTELSTSSATEWINADVLRKQFDDWDFSHQGRIRQSRRMREIADVSNRDFIIADFVCPLSEMRSIFEPHFLIWVDTIAESRFEDTNQVFVAPAQYDIRVTEQDASKWAKLIYEQILKDIK